MRQSPGYGDSPWCFPGPRSGGLVRRFFWDILRGTVGGVVSVVLSVAGGGIASTFERKGLVTGPAGAQVLAMVDAARPARGAWLVHTSSRVGVIDSGPVFADPVDADQPAFLWQGSGPRVHADKATHHLARRLRLPVRRQRGGGEYLRQPDAR